MPRKKDTNLEKRISKIVDAKLDDNIENKTYTYGVRETAIDNLGFVRPCFLPIQGTGDANRIGDKVKVQNIQVSLSFLYSDTSNFVRFILFRDMMGTQGAIQPTPILGTAAVLQEAADNGYLWPATGSEAYAPSLFNNKSRYQILMDRKLNMISTGSSGQLQVERFIKRNMNVHFNGPTVADLDKGTLYYLMLSNSGAPAHPGCNGYIRIVYQDA